MALAEPDVIPRPDVGSAGSKRMLDAVPDCSMKRWKGTLPEQVQPFISSAAGPSHPSASGLKRLPAHFEAGFEDGGIQEHALKKRLRLLHASPFKKTYVTRDELDTKAGACTVSAFHVDLERAPDAASSISQMRHALSEATSLSSWRSPTPLHKAGSLPKDTAAQDTRLPPGLADDDDCHMSPQQATARCSAPECSDSKAVSFIEKEWHRLLSGLSLDSQLSHRTNPVYAATHCNKQRPSLQQAAVTSFFRKLPGAPPSQPIAPLAAHQHQQPGPGESADHVSAPMQVQGPSGNPSHAHEQPSRAPVSPNHRVLNQLVQGHASHGISPHRKAQQQLNEQLTRFYCQQQGSSQEAANTAAAGCMHPPWAHASKQAGGLGVQGGSCLMATEAVGTAELGRPHNGTVLAQHQSTAQGLQPLQHMAGSIAGPSSQLSHGSGGSTKQRKSGASTLGGDIRTMLASQQQPQTAGLSSSMPAPGKRLVAGCPICGTAFPPGCSNAHVNEHIDKCLASCG